MYTPLQVKFYDYTNYKAEQISVLKVPMGENRMLKTELSYLVSHISMDEGVIAFNTSIDDKGTEWVEVEYIDSLTQKLKIMQELNSDSLYFTRGDGSNGTMVNPFQFNEE
jgi:hypothetical protein